MKKTIFNAFLSKASHTESHDNFYRGDVWNFILFKGKIFNNKTCHRDRIACLTAPCPSHKKLFRKNFNILLTPTPTLSQCRCRGSTIALPGLRPGELKMAVKYGLPVYLKI